MGAFGTKIAIFPRMDRNLQQQNGTPSDANGPATAPVNGHNRHNGHNGNNHAAHDIFWHFAARTSNAVGSPWAFALAIGVVLAWAITGPIFHYSDSWQLVINTGTTIVTFVMVFLIQNMQNRDSRAIHLKLDELIKTTKLARNQLVDVENVPEDEMRQLEAEFHKVRAQADQAAMDE